MSRLRLRRVFWIGAAAILVAAALVALGAIAQGRFSDTDGRILLTLTALLYTGGAALAGLALIDRRVATALGWLVAAAAPVCLALVSWAIWSFVEEGDGSDTPDKLAWSSVLILLAGLLAVTALLLTRRRALAPLAVASGVLSGIAAGLSVIGIWTETNDDAYVKTLAALWILAALSYFLVPVLQRFTATREEERPARVIAELDGVELVASRHPVEGVAVPAPVSGEQLFLRRRD